MDLEPHIEDLIHKTELALKATDWKRTDKYLFEFRKNKTVFEHSSIYFLIEPDILNYEESNQYVAKIWLKIHGAFSDEAKQILFNCLTPFKDEDYRGYYYWINPYYPQGYFYNHVL